MSIPVKNAVCTLEFEIKKRTSEIYLKGICYVVLRKPSIDRMACLIHNGTIKT